MNRRVILVKDSVGYIFVVKEKQAFFPEEVVLDHREPRTPEGQERLREVVRGCRLPRWVENALLTALEQPECKVEIEYDPL